MGHTRMRLLLAGLMVLCLFVAVSAGAEENLKIEARCDAAALAPEVEVEVKVLIAIRAPEIPSVATRPPVAVSLVIDRSGSMEEAKKIDYAKAAGKVLVRSLKTNDLFALTVYDSEVQVLYPLAKVTDKEKLIRMINAIRPGSTTFLSGGLEKGIEQLKSIRKEGPCRVILLSDGLANRGITGAEQVAAIGARARNTGVSVSTIGLGLDFDETLMQLLAQRGGGQYYYIKDSEDLPAVFRQEMNLVAASFTRDMRVVFTRAKGVENLKIYGYSSTDKNRDTDIEMGDLSAGENRQMLLRFKVKSGASGKQDLGVLRFRYTDQNDGKPRDISVPLHLDVVADKAVRDKTEAAQASVLREVRAEAALLDAEEAHVAAMAELEKGNVKNAKAMLQAAQGSLAAAPSSQANSAKIAAMARDESQLEQAAQDEQMQKSMNKASKASAYQSSKGQKQGLMLQRGDKGYQVEKLQQALKDQGYYAGDVDGLFGPELEKAVQKFQRSKLLPANGIADPATLGALGL